MADDLEDIKKIIGNKSTAEDVVTASQVGRLAATLGVEHPARKNGDPVPPGWHGVFFPGLVPLSRLGEDGQPKAGGPGQGSPLPRRRIIGIRSTFHDALRVGDEITRETETMDVVIEDYGAGPTIVMKIRDSISTPRGLAVEEDRDFLSYADGGPGEMWPPPAMPDNPTWSKTYEPTPAMIFRMSATRYNSHRIHYDRDYATKVEGYDGLVVPVTLVSFLMMEICRAEAPDRPMTYFAYRGKNRLRISAPTSSTAGSMVTMSRYGRPITPATFPSPPRRGCRAPDRRQSFCRRSRN